MRIRPAATINTARSLECAGLTAIDLFAAADRFTFKFLTTAITDQHLCHPIPLTNIKVVPS
jgi:hypothetical protein